MTGINQGASPAPPPQRADMSRVDEIVRSRGVSSTSESARSRAARIGASARLMSTPGR